MTEYQLKTKKVERLPDCYEPELTDILLGKGKKYRLELFSDDSIKLRLGQDAMTPSGSVIYFVDDQEYGRIKAWGIDIRDETGKVVHDSYSSTEYRAEEDPKMLNLLAGRQHHDGVHAKIDSNDLVNLWRAYFLLTASRRLKMHKEEYRLGDALLGTYVTYRSPLIDHLWVAQKFDDAGFAEAFAMGTITRAFKAYPPDASDAKDARKLFSRNHIPLTMSHIIPRAFPNDSDSKKIYPQGHTELIFSLDDVVNA